MWNVDIAEYHGDSFTEFRYEMCRIRLRRYIPGSILTSTKKWFRRNFMTHIKRGGNYEEQLALVEWHSDQEYKRYVAGVTDNRETEYKSYSSPLVQFLPRPWSCELLSGCLDRCLGILFCGEIPYPADRHQSAKIDTCVKCLEYGQSGEKFGARLVHVSLLESINLEDKIDDWTEKISPLGGYLGPLVHIAEYLFGTFTI